MYHSAAPPKYCSNSRCRTGLTTRLSARSSHENLLLTLPLVCLWKTGGPWFLFNLCHVCDKGNEVIPANNNNHFQNLCCTPARRKLIPCRIRNGRRLV